MNEMALGGSREKYITFNNVFVKNEKKNIAY